MHKCKALRGLLRIKHPAIWWLSSILWSCKFRLKILWGYALSVRFFFFLLVIFKILLRPTFCLQAVFFFFPSLPARLENVGRQGKIYLKCELSRLGGRSWLRHRIYRPDQGDEDGISIPATNSLCNLVSVAKLFLCSIFLVSKMSIIIVTFLIRVSVNQFLKPLSTERRKIAYQRSLAFICASVFSELRCL